MVTYWLYHGERLLGSKRLRAGLGAVDVRAAAAQSEIIFCDRPYETPASMRARLRHADVVVYDDRATQLKARRDLPFELRALFPGEQPFFELRVLAQPRPGDVASVAAAIEAMRAAAAELSLTLSSERTSAFGRLVRVEDPSGSSLHDCAEAIKTIAMKAGLQIVSEFGVGYRLNDTTLAASDQNFDHEPERPRG